MAVITPADGQSSESTTVGIEHLGLALLPAAQVGGGLLTGLFRLAVARQLGRETAQGDAPANTLTPLTNGLVVSKNVCVQFGGRSPPGTQTKEETMRRKSRTVWAVGIAVLAMCAAMASGASAAQYHSEGENTTFTGTSTSSMVIDAAGASLTCQKATYSAVQASKTSEVLTMSVAYAGCSFLFFNVSVNMNGCDLVFHANGEFDIGGAECNGITFEGAACKVVFPSQAGHISIGLTNTGSGATRNVDVSHSVTGIIYTASGLCPVTGTKSNGNFTSGTFNLVGNKGGVWVE